MLVELRRQPELELQPKRLRDAMGGLLRDLVRTRGEDAPVAVFLDGIERADLPSLELLHTTLADNLAGPLLLAVSSLNRALLNQLGRAATAERRSSIVVKALERPSLARLLERVSGRNVLEDFTF